MTDSSLLQDFIVETLEHLEDTERNLLRLEKQATDVDVLNDIFRSIHTIKGSSEYLGLARIAEISHKLESLLDLLRRGERELEVKVIDLLIDTNDRIAQLVEDLSQHEEERAVIDDLVARIDVVTGNVTPVSAEEAAGETISEGDWDAIEDEYDEELFGIFVDQLKDNIQGIVEETKNLLKGDNPEKTLHRYEDRLVILQSSANYMGYDKLKQVYTQWSQGVTNALRRFGDGKDVDWHAFSHEVTNAHIDRVKAFFPKVDGIQLVGMDTEKSDESALETKSEKKLLDEDDLDIEPLYTGSFEVEELGLELPGEQAFPSHPEEEIQPELALFSDDEDEMSLEDTIRQDENPLLNDFLIETREHLEITERNLLRLEQQPDDPEMLNEIFRSIHTIKGSAEYLGLDGIAELSHKLENLLDLIRRGERNITKISVDLLITTNDRIAQLVDDLERYQVEQSPFDDIVRQIEALIEAPEIETVDEAESQTETEPHEQQETFDEDYDGELFTIFIDQLKDGLQSLCSETRKLFTEQTIEKTMWGYEERLTTLRSAANYMGYESLKQIYDQWIHDAAGVRNDFSEGRSVDWRSFAKQTTVEFIDRVKGFFPQVDSLQQLDLSFDDLEEADISEPDSISIIEDDVEADIDIATSADQSLLADFIAETKEHLEEIEQNLMLLEQTPEDIDVLNDLFRSIHTIKGSSEYLGMERIAELSHKLENLLDMLRNGQRTADSNIVELLISANDRIGHLIDDLVHNQSEETEISDLILQIDNCSTEERDEETPPDEHVVSDARLEQVTQSEKASAQDSIYQEDYDQELFSIFKKHFHEGLQSLAEFADRLKTGEEAYPAISECKKILLRLRSSANYMEYNKLRALYDEWIEAIDVILGKLSAGDQIFVSHLSDEIISANIEKARSFFMTSDSEALFDAVPKIEDLALAKEDLSIKVPTDQDETGEQDNVSEELESAEQADEAAVTEIVEDGGETNEVVAVEPDDETAEAEIAVHEDEAIITEVPEQEPEIDEADTAADQIDEIRDAFGETFADKDMMSGFPLGNLDIDISQDDFAPLSIDELDVGDEQSLLSRLESAFDAKIDEVANSDFSALTKLDVVKELLSDEDPNDNFDDESSYDTSAGGQPAGKALDLSNLESFLSSGGEGGPAPRKTLAPAPLASLTEHAEISPLAADDDDQSRVRQLGRRRSDRFHERLLKQSIRVDASKIDSLMNQVGELVVTRAGFTQLFSEMHELQLMLKQAQLLDPKEMQLFKALTSRVNDATVSLGRITSELQENVMKVRMLPIAQLFSRYPRVVHDLIRNSPKKVDLDIRGEDTELDRMVIEQISDPLIHIIRNAVDHGIEIPDERQRKGKAEVGVLRLEAYHEGNYVVIEVTDDGNGIDVELVKNKAISKGFAKPDELADMTPEQVMGLIMLPGFSTTDEVTTTSGRGVGMDVVKDNIEKLNGTIETESTLGKGTLFRIKIPLTLAIIPALMINVAGETFTIPLSAVDETIRIHRNEISRIEGIEVYYLRESTLPLIRVADIFKMRSGYTDPNELFVVVVNTGNRQVGLIVDQLKGREEVVVKPLEDYLQEKSGFSGATILGDGSISLILDVADLMNLAVEQHMRKRKAVAI